MAVKFGDTPELRCAGLTTNISARGLGISTNFVFSPGTQLFMVLQLPDGSVSQVSGVVTWFMSPITGLTLPGGMGVCIETADEPFFSFLAGVSPPERAGVQPGAAATIARQLEHPKSRPPPSPAQAILAAPIATAGSAAATSPLAPQEAASPLSSAMDTPGAARPHILPVRDLGNGSPRGQQKPRAPRVPRRAPCRIGTTLELRDLGMTVDVSSRGLCLTASHVHPVGTRLLLEIALPKMGVSRLSGLVVWVVKPLPALALDGSMGICVDSADEQFLEFLTVAKLCAPYGVSESSPSAFGGGSAFAAPLPPDEAGPR